jgi:4,5-DOPA dioxygenase extradiol
MNHTRRHIVNATLSATLLSLANLAEAASTSSVKRMPSIFVGHGSPMNAVQNNDFTRMLQKWGTTIGVMSVEV